ncbi:MAG TPA: hypothetical protein VHN77_01650 [Phycisphaerales bacterium]|nr:hypothetical protein [Phycisphaerales bacterium]
MRCPFGIPASCLILGLPVGVARAQSCPPRWQGFALGGPASSLYRAPDNLLYIGGDFTTPASHIASFSGTSFAPVGDGLDGSVLDIITHDDGSGPRLYVTGFFGVPAAQNSNLAYARLNGTQFQTYGSTIGPTSWTGHMASYNFGAGPRLVVSAPSHMNFCEYIAEWTGTGWQCMADGLASVTHDSQLFDDGHGLALFCVGSFVINGGSFQDSLGIAKWTGSAWLPVGGGLRDGPGYTCEVFDSGEGPELVVGGHFTRVGPGANWVSARYAARWNGTRWAALGTGFNNEVRALEPFDDGSGPALYAAGTFTTADGQPAQRLAKWTGTQWLPCPAGGIAAGTIEDLCAFDPDGPGPAPRRLAIAGTFASVGTTPAMNFATLIADAGIDFNNDGVYPDTQDINDFLAVFSGGPCPTQSCNTIDFNGDGLFPDTSDIDAFLSVFSGGPCG